MRTVPNPVLRHFRRVPLWGWAVAALELASAGGWVISPHLRVIYTATLVTGACVAGVALSVRRSNADVHRANVWFAASSARMISGDPDDAEPAPAPAAIESGDMCESCRRWPAARFVIIDGEVFNVCSGCTPETVTTVGVVA
jgi:hypothetical protein